MSFTAKVTTLINAPADIVWLVLTTPELVKEYLFGTEVHTDWEVGSTITYTGIWDGKDYEDKGEILEVEENKLLKSTYWSSASGKEDKPENYNTVTYILAEHDGKTELTIEQDNIDDQESANHSEKNWKMVIDNIKEIAERE